MKTTQLEKPTRPSADATRKKILKAAQKLFSQQGFAGTSISHITKKAKINQSLIYHHFGSKQELWQAVKGNLTEAQLMPAIESLFQQPLDFPTFLTKYITIRFEFYDENPDIKRMVSWQRLEDIQADLSYGHCLYDKWRNAFSRFQQQGQISSTIQPNLALILINNATTGFFMDYPVYFAKQDANELKKLKQDYLQLLCDGLIKVFKE